MLKKNRVVSIDAKSVIKVHAAAKESIAEAARYLAIMERLLCGAEGGRNVTD